MKKYRIAERRRAIERGMDFIYRVASDAQIFDDYGHDLLLFFNIIAQTAQDGRLRATARKMGRERARQWRRDYSALPSEMDADTVAHMVFGSSAADGLGVRNAAFKSGICRAARRFSAKDYFSFDPSTEPPPSDVPKYCDCGESNSRGQTVCASCRKPLCMESRYSVWCVALARSFAGDRYGARLGARLADVIKWLPVMRPYRGRENGKNEDFNDSVYAVTHVVYTLNGYGVYNLSPVWLADEFEFLKANQQEAIALKDADMLGEFLDALQSFGLTDNDPLIRAGIDFLLSEQNADGSWGDKNDDAFNRYHATWTAIDGLREYRWQGEGLSFPRLKSVLERAAKDSTARMKTTS
ncbi:MAG TPA: hypothetical protein VJX74_15730 [Blastocatellia bacterium]|nr:hypothetical protein [Blastocatellia bacterium]